MATQAESKPHSIRPSLPDSLNRVIVFMIVALIMHYYIGLINPTDGFCHPTDEEMLEVGG